MAFKRFITSKIKTIVKPVKVATKLCMKCGKLLQDENERHDCEKRGETRLSNSNRTD